MQALFKFGFTALLTFSPLLRSQAAPLNLAAEQALQGDAAASVTLRANGQRGLDALLYAAHDLVEDMRSGRVALSSAEAAKVRELIDQVAGQRDAFASGLYWYTDLKAAQAEATRTHRQILSLHMLGRLDQELSCANSRFFRTVLYANVEVAHHLRDHYVLHWHSVRPVPVVTVDMGDGRQLHRTIAGNSAHYVLNANGQVIDALPGLYGPAAFLEALAVSELFTPQHDRARWYSSQAGRILAAWQRAADDAGIAENVAASAAAQPTQPLAMSAVIMGPTSILSPASLPSSTKPLDLNKVNQPLDFKPSQPASTNEFKPFDSTPVGPVETIYKTGQQQLTFFGQESPMAAPNTFPSFPRTLFTTGAKASIERGYASISFADPGLQIALARPTSLNTASTASATTTLTQPNASLALAPQSSPRQRRPTQMTAKELALLMTPEHWTAISVVMRGKVHLDESSRRFMLAKLDPLLISTDERRQGRATDDTTPVARTLAQLEHALCIDTAMNEFLYHRQIYEWLAADSQGRLKDVAVLNARVYDELFLTPDADPWLGLLPEHTYSAIEHAIEVCQPMTGASR